jgi:hypothetical protein
MSQITARRVRSIYVSYIKCTFYLYNLDLTPNKNRVELQRANITAFGSLVLFLFNGLDSTDK